jgi:hypothetical protein
MGVGSAIGWLWERMHRSGRSDQPDVDTAPVVSRPHASPPPSPIATSQPGDTVAVGAGTLPPKTLVIIFGPPAVGKMTVGASLARRTGLRLFHNHLTIELVLRFFEFGSPPFKRLVSEFRTRIFEEVAASSLPGMIFTYVWAVDDPSDTRSVERLSGIFRGRGADVYLVELESTQEERLRRNETEFRLSEKESKRDVTASRARLLEHDAVYRMNTQGEFANRPDYLRIDNTNVSADDAAEMIIRHFGLAELSAVELS